MIVEELMEEHTRRLLVAHLQEAHGYHDDECDADPEAMRAPESKGIVRVSHPIWTLGNLQSIHDDDHAGFGAGTPVESRAHHHERTGATR